MGIPPEDGHASVGNFVALGLNVGKVDDNLLTLRAIWVYAVYRATNNIRRNATTNGEVSTDVLQQFAKEAVRGHAYATRVLDGITRHDSSNPAASTGTRDAHERAIDYMIQESTGACHRPFFSICRHIV